MGYRYANPYRYHYAGPSFITTATRTPYQLSCNTWVTSTQKPLPLSSTRDFYNYRYAHPYRNRYMGYRYANPYRYFTTRDSITTKHTRTPTAIGTWVTSTRTPTAISTRDSITTATRALMFTDIRPPTYYRYARPYGYMGPAPVYYATTRPKWLLIRRQFLCSKH